MSKKKKTITFENERTVETGCLEISSELQEEKKSGNHAKVLGRGVALSKAGWMQTFYYYSCFFLKIELYEFFMKKVI